MQSRIDQIIKNWRFSGVDPEEEFVYLGQELTNKQKKLHYRQKIMLGGVKMAVFIIFFLGSYFWMLLSFVTLFIEGDFLDTIS